MSDYAQQAADWLENYRNKTMTQINSGVTQLKGGIIRGGFFRRSRATAAAAQKKETTATDSVSTVSNTDAGGAIAEVADSTGVSTSASTNTTSVGVDSAVSISDNSTSNDDKNSKTISSSSSDNSVGQDGDGLDAGNSIVSGESATVAVVEETNDTTVDSNVQKIRSEEGEGGQEDIEVVCSAQLDVPVLADSLADSVGDSDTEQ
jgi:hypothetical protein